MATIIRATDHQQAASGVAFNFDDMSAQAQRYLDGMRGEAMKIIKQAHEEANAIRKQAEQEGQRAAMASVEQVVEKKLTAVLPALHQAVDEIRQAKQTWLSHWEACGVRVAAAIAQRVIRRELTQQPEIPVALVREALELASGSSELQIRLNPADHAALGGRVESIVREMAGLGETRVIADPEITTGGCRIDTRFGSIDQQIESQLARIEEELTQ